MSEPVKIIDTVVAPMLNANEDEISIVDVCVKSGELVTLGQTLFVVESTKTTADVVCENAGHVREVTVQNGQQVAVGATLCLMADRADGEIARENSEVAKPAAEPEISADHNIKATRAAEELAAQRGIKLASLNLDRIITTKDVVAANGGGRSGRPSSPIEVHTSSSSAQIVILGGGSHARALIELIRISRKDLLIVAAVDDGKHPATDVLGVPVIGDSDELPRLRSQGVRYAAMGVGAVTNPQLRQRLFDRLVGYGFELPSFIHPRAMVEDSVTMGAGNQIFAGAVVGTLVTLGNNTLINCGCVLSHDCRVASHSHIAPGAILAGGVSVGENSTVGMGCTVYLGKSIGRDVIIGNGVHVFDNVEDGKFVRPKKQLGRAA